ncbi:MAG TPA: V-type ATP synthase subunit D [Candidatus Omnitrophica bacterium]|nr:V-type ATP synthase subunit D [Candidatus Omnitrophota bacterium]
MPKLKLTKNELKKQKDSLQRFSKYLPMLQLKKQQLQFEILRIKREMEIKQNNLDSLLHQVDEWVDLFSEGLKIEDWFKVENVITENRNIAGVDIAVFKDIKFKEHGYDLYTTPLWVDKGIEALREAARLKSEQALLIRQIEVLSQELSITSQRVNLFEKVKIPQSKDNIRRIKIFLGDIFTAEVVRGKIAKSKLSQN